MFMTKVKLEHTCTIDSLDSASSMLGPVIQH
jgi:hypothetical protein